MSPAMVEDQRNKSTFPWSCLFIFTIVPVGGNIRYLGSILTYATVSEERLLYFESSGLSYGEW